MPQLKRPILESDQAVVRPIVFGVLEDIKHRIFLPHEIKVQFNGDQDATFQPGTAISNKGEQYRFPETSKLTIEVSERLIDDLRSTTFTYQPEHIPLWLNDALEVEMRPIYASVELVISIRYRVNSRSEARRFYDFMMMKLRDRDDTTFHDIKYGISLPLVYTEILKEIHRLQELQAGYGETFEEFFNKGVKLGYTEETDQAGKNVLGVFADTQSRCLGFFDIPDTPDKAVKEEGTDAYMVEFPYTLRYEKPMDVYFRYPIVIHNSVLSSRYRPKTRMMLESDKLTERSVSMNAFTYFDGTRDFKSDVMSYPGRTIPDFDEFVPRSVPDFTKRVFTILVLLGEEDLTVPLMNLNDLEHESIGMKLADAVKNAIVSESPWITNYRKSIFHLGFYKGRIMQAENLLEIDEDFNIRYTGSLDEFSKRKYYHLRLSMITDLSILDDDAKNRLKLMPDLIGPYLDYVLPNGITPPEFGLIGDQVDPKDWGSIVDITTQYNNPDFFIAIGQARKLRTVQHAVLSATRR